ncbi:PTS system cellobiose-specific IIC component [Enterococcus sp. DIV0840]
MKKFLDWLERILTPMAKVIGENKYLVAIRDGFLLSTPLLIVGSIFLLIANFPLPQWDQWMSGILGADWAEHMAVPANASFDVMTILAVVGIAYSFGRQFKVDAMQAGIISLVSFFIVTPYYTEYTLEGTEQLVEVASLPLKWMGSNGLFLGMIVALISTRIFVWV